MPSVVIPAKMSVASTLFVDVPINAKPASGGSPVDLTIYPVFLAFVPKRTEVVDNDWLEAEWSPDGKTAGVLVGPDGDVTLAAGSYVVCWRVDTPQEIPKEAAPGGLTIVELT